MKRLAAIAAVAASVAIAGTADAQSVESFYKGRQMDVLIGSAPGGGFDLYARLIARHMPDYIPGNPNIVPKNVPGAGSAKAAATLYAVSPKDGSTFGALFPGAIMDALFDARKRTQYDPTRFGYLGSANNEVATCMIWHEAPVKTLKDTFTTEAIVGASASGGSSRDFAAALQNVLGSKLRIVAGYEGSKDMLLAMERGEIHGICGQLWSSIVTQSQDWLREDKLVFWVQMALKPHPDLEKRGVPMVWDFVKTDRDRQILELIFGQLEFGRPYVLPPGVPADRVKALREAFLAAQKDEGYKAEAAKAKLEVNPVSGDRVQELVTRMFATPPDIIKAAADAQITKK
ncbi:MAG: Bug family tripartite tricarboxylate transporter substrate binding protein [Gemmatimonas sp.]